MRQGPSLSADRGQLSNWRTLAASDSEYNPASRIVSSLSPDFSKSVRCRSKSGRPLAVLTGHLPARGGRPCRRLSVPLDTLMSC
jgi:hypothetical protein